MKSLEIALICSDKIDRPKFHFKISEYLAIHIFNNLIVFNKSLSKVKYGYRIVIGFFTEINSISEEGEFLFSKSRYIDIIDSKSINVSVPFNINLYDDNKLDAYCYMIIFSILAVLTEEFKSFKIDIEMEVQKLMESIDVDYISSFKYPAEMIDQNYLNDKAGNPITI